MQCAHELKGDGFKSERGVGVLEEEWALTFLLNGSPYGNNVGPAFL